MHESSFYDLDANMYFKNKNEIGNIAVEHLTKIFLLL